MYRGLRRDAALLISEGYTRSEAWGMSLAMLWTEAEIARDREHNRMATEAILIRSAVVDVVAGGDHLRQSLEDLRGYE